MTDLYKRVKEALDGYTDADIDNYYQLSVTRAFIRERDAAEALAEAAVYFSTAFSGKNADKLLNALAAYRAARDAT